MHCNKKERKSMAREKKGDLVEGRERNTPLRCVVIERGESVCTLGMHCNKEEEKKKQWLEKKGDPVEGRVHAPSGCITIERRQMASILRKK
jgi:hypothetical protein